MSRRGRMLPLGRAGKSLEAVADADDRLDHDDRQPLALQVVPQPLRDIRLVLDDQHWPFHMRNYTAGRRVSEALST